MTGSQAASRAASSESREAGVVRAMGASESVDTVFLGKEGERRHNIMNKCHQPILEI